MEHESTGFPALHVEDAVDQARSCLENKSAESAARTLFDLRRRFPAEARLRQLEGIVAERLGRTAKAERCYRRAVELRPNESEYALDLVELLVSQGRTCECRSTLEAVMSRDPKNPRAHGLEGLLSVKGGRYAAAEICLRKALDLDPSYAWAARELSDVFFHTGRLEDAHRVVVDLLDRDPIDARNHGYLGELLERRGLLEQSITAYRTALWLKSDYAWAAYRLARILHRQRKHVEAQAVLRDVLRVVPREPKLLTLLAVVEQRLGNAAAAARCYRAVLRLEPRSDRAFRGLLSLYVATRRFSAARRLLWDRVLGNPADLESTDTRSRPKEP